MKLVVTLNGTNGNPWHKMGLKQNPFPQIPRSELMPYMNTLAKLDADPIPNIDYIKETLRGWSEEFIELCCRMFMPGERVRFVVTFPNLPDKS